MEDKKRCQHCTCVNGHHYKCPNATMQEAFQWLENRVIELDRALTRANRNHVQNHQQVMFWHGKYAIVKLENNALRRKLWQHGRHKKENPDGET